MHKGFFSYPPPRLHSMGRLVSKRILARDKSRTLSHQCILLLPLAAVTESNKPVLILMDSDLQHLLTVSCHAFVCCKKIYNATDVTVLLH